MIERLDFPFLARGAYGLAPPGSLQAAGDGPLWRYLHNLRPVDGELRRREAVIASEDSSALHSPPWLDDEDQYVKLIVELAPGSQQLSTARRHLVVTSREMFIKNASTWYNVTPVYEVGTVSITSGTASLTGSGTLWRTRRIAATQQVELPRDSGDWYEIDSVNGDTSITLATNYTGTTLSGDNYSIRRTFLVPSTNPGYPTFAEVLNGDIYVAGMVSTGEGFTAAATAADGGVIKIAGGASRSATSFDPANDVSFIFSARSEVETGVDYLDYNVLLVPGFTALADGRLVMAVHWIDLSTGESGQNRVLFSSHTPDVSFWSVSPGGFYDIVDFQGNITTMVRGTRYLSLHFNDGIEVGQITGQDDDPIAWNPSRSSVGAIGPRCVARIPRYRTLGGEIFVGADLRLYVFDGSNSVPVDLGFEAHLRDDPWSTFVAATNVGEIEQYGWVRFNPHRGEFSLHWRRNEVRVRAATGDLSFHQYPLELTAGCFPISEFGTVDLGALAGYVGAFRQDSGGTDRHLIYELREGVADDSTAGFSSLIGVVEAGGDVLDFGDPTRTKGISEIQVYARGATATSETMSIAIYRDGSLETVSAAAVTLSTTEETMWRFFPSKKSGQLYRLNLQPPNEARLTRMVVFYAYTGDERAA